MKQPDKFEQMVDTVLTCDFMVGKYDAIALLRRQHRAYVRLVKQAMGHRMWAYVMLEDPGKMWISRTDLLAAFTRYRKGTR